METPLSRQLQQAWLHTQMRKHHQQQQQQQLDPPSSAHPSLPPSLDSPSSSFASNSLSPPDASSLPPHDTSDDHQSLRDPVLQFLDDMLMEEDLEDRKCMQFECTAYQATAKGFYDILGDSEEPGAVDPGFGAHEQQAELSGSLTDGEDYNWMDNFLNSEAVNQLEEALALAERRALSAQGGSGLSPPFSSDSSGSPLFSPEQSFENTSQSSNESAPPRWNAVTSPVAAMETPHSTDNAQNMAFPRSSLLNLPVYENSGNALPTGGQFQPVLDSPENLLNFDPQQRSGQKKPFRRVVSDNSDVVTSTSAASNASRFKRAASERDSGSSGSPSPWDAERAEDVSFVQNKNLNAEALGEMLHGGSICSGKPCKNSSSSGREGSGGVGGKVFQKPETTVDLTGLLINCAQAVVSADLHQANYILQQIRRDSTPYGDGVQRLAHYFAEGLVARLSGTGGRLYSAFTNNVPSAAKMLGAHHLFVEGNPYVKVSHFFANKAILEAAEGSSRLHIVDYGILYGLQWPSLISALAGRKGGPPHLRLTAIEFPQPGVKSAERVEMTGRRLAEYAKTYGVQFDYRAIASKWENVQPSSLNLKQDEVLVVNSMFRLRHLLDETVLASNPRKTVLCRIKSMNPKVFVMGIKNGGYNSPFFKSRFREALSCYSYKFDMLDATIPRDNQDRLMIERESIGRDIINVIACEGPERVERPETYRQWRNRTQRAGFEQLRLDANVVKKVRAIVKCSYHKDFGVDEDGEWLLLSWKGQVMHGLSLWKPSSKENS